MRSFIYKVCQIFILLLDAQSIIFIIMGLSILYLNLTDMSCFHYVH